MKTLATILICVLNTLNLYASRTFTNVTADLINSNVELSWSISFSNNMGLFEIQKMDKNGKFQSYHSIKLSEEITYSYVDTKPAIGHNYYRIALLINDEVYYSKVIVVTYNSTEAIVLYPNPGNGEKLNIILNGINSKEATIRIFGRKAALVKEVKLRSEVNDFFTLNNLNLESGIYYLVIITPEVTLKRKFFIEE